MSTIEQLLHEAYTNWDDAPRLSRIGCELQVRSRFGDARRILRRAVELEPSDTDAWANLSFSCFRSLEDEEGRAILKEGIQKTNADLLRSTLLGFSEGEEADALAEALEDSTEPSVRAALLSRRVWAGEHREALDALRALVAEHPDDADLRDSFLWTLVGARNRNDVEGLDLHEEGIPEVDRALVDRPDELHLRWMRLMMLQAEQDWDGLLEESAKTLELFPDEETVMQFRGRAYREKGDADRATQWFLRAVGAKPTFAGARIDLGRLYEKEGKLDLAEEVFRELPRANRTYPVAPLSLALFLGRHDRWEEAERRFIEAWPNLPETFKVGFAQNPEVKTFFERDAVKEALGTPVPQAEPTAG